MKKVMILLTVLMVVFAISGCKKEEGKFEKLGKQTDKLTKKTAESMKEASEKVEKKTLALSQKIEVLNSETNALKDQENSLNEKVRIAMIESKELQDENILLKNKRKKASKEALEELQKDINNVVLEIKMIGREEEELRSSIREITTALDANKIKSANLNTEIYTQERLLQQYISKKEQMLKLHEPTLDKYKSIISAVARVLMPKNQA